MIVLKTYMEASYRHSSKVIAGVRPSQHGEKKTPRRLPQIRAAKPPLTSSRHARLTMASSHIRSQQRSLPAPDVGVGPTSGDGPREVFQRSGPHFR